MRTMTAWTDFTDLNLCCIKGALALVVLVSFSGYVCSAFQSTLNSPIVSYRIVTLRLSLNQPLAIDTGNGLMNMKTIFLSLRYQNYNYTINKLILNTKNKKSYVSSKSRGIYNIGFQIITEICRSFAVYPCQYMHQCVQQQNHRRARISNQLANNCRTNLEYSINLRQIQLLQLVNVEFVSVSKEQ